MIVVHRIAGLIFLCLFALASAEAVDIQKLGRDCQKGNQKACVKLADIAEKGTDLNLRIAAVGVINDQKVPAVIARFASPVGDAAFAKITDQAVLARIAGSYWSYKSRTKAAFAKLNDERVLAGLAKGDDFSLRHDAVEKITEEAALIDVATNARHVDVQIVAVRKLANQQALARIANQGFPDVAQEAARKLTDQSVLAELARTHKEAKVRKAATGNVTSEALLAEIFERDADPDVRVPDTHAPRQSPDSLFESRTRLTLLKM